MKALTLHQPWASLVACDAKTIETRSWSTKYRGPLAIHAAVKVPRLPRFPTRKSQRTESTAADVAAHELDDPTSAVPGSKICWCGHDALMCLRHGLCTLPLGEVLATCTLVDVVPMVPAGVEGAIRTLDIDADGSLWIVESRAYPSLRDVSEASRSEYLAGQDYTDPAAWEDFCDRKGLTGSLDQRDVSDQRPYGDFTPGRYAWLLDDIKPLTDPVPSRGRQQLWEWTP